MSDKIAFVRLEKIKKERIITILNIGMKSEMMKMLMINPLRNSKKNLKVSSDLSISGTLTIIRWMFGMGAFLRNLSCFNLF